MRIKYNYHQVTNSRTPLNIESLSISVKSYCLDQKEKSEVYKLSGKRLGCFCKPMECHGDVLADYLNSWDDGK